MYIKREIRYPSSNQRETSSARSAGWHIYLARRLSAAYYKTTN